MQSTSIHRSPVRAPRRDAIPATLIVAATLLALTLGALLFHLATMPQQPSMFPPADWAVAPPNWID
jgi:hypothetical protein